MKRIVKFTVCDMCNEEYRNSDCEQFYKLIIPGIAGQEEKILDDVCSSCIDDLHEYINNK